MRTCVATAIIVWGAACGASGSAPDAAPDGAPDSAPDAAPDASPDASVDASTICLNEDRDDPYVPGMAKVGASGYQVTLVTSTPGPPQKGDNHWTVEVRDPASATVDGLRIDVVPFMPDHGHGTPVAEVVTGVDNGVYEIDRVNLWMHGLWVSRISLFDAQNAELDRVPFAFCIDRP